MHMWEWIMLGLLEKSVTHMWMWNSVMLKQRIGTTISMKNSDIMFYPSLTFCRLGGLENYTTINTLTHTPNLTDVVVRLQAYDRRNNSTFTVTAENRESSWYFLSQITFKLTYLKPPFLKKIVEDTLLSIRTTYLYGHYALWLKPYGGVKLSVFLTC